MLDANQPIRLLLVDDHALFRRGLRQLLEAEPDLKVVAEAENGEEAVQHARELYPSQLDLVLMDIEMPRLDGIEATKRILTDIPRLPIIMLTSSSEDRDLIAASDAGSVGFLPKSLRPELLVEAIRAYRRDGSLPMTGVMAGRLLAYYREQVQALAGEPDPQSRQLSPELRRLLTPRELEVLALLADGLSDREIAKRLTLAPRTASVHVHNVLRKLDVQNRTEAASLYHKGKK